MAKTKFGKYCAAAFVAVFIASAYPLYMTACVIIDMLRNGAVFMADYPKYIIPYAPICFAVLAGAALMPALVKRSRLLPSAICLAVFFAAERLLETCVLVQAMEAVPLESWQMSLCYVPPAEYATRTWEAVDVLLGGYSPAFKLHFYLISAVIILSAVSCIYGFGKAILTGDGRARRLTAAQSISGAVFLGLNILACFTSFFRDGELTVPPISAALMSAFFVTLGLTFGLFIAGFTRGKALIPAISASLAVTAMYIGEMILLSGELYRFGGGAFFGGLPLISLAPVDIVIIVFSGALTAAILRKMNRGRGA